MDMTASLLLAAFQCRIKEADAGAGIARFEALIGRKIGGGEVRDAPACAVVRSKLRDPVRLLAGCSSVRWNVERGTYARASTPSGPCFTDLIC